MKFNKKIKQLTATGLLNMLAVSTALAHTPYLLPTTFGPTRNDITLLAALTDEDIFVPEMPIRDGEYYRISPSGEKIKLDKVVTLKNFAAMDIELTQDGTYKVTTGEKAGRVMKMANIDGRWLTIRPARSERPGAEKNDKSAKPGEKKDKPGAGDMPKDKASAGKPAPRFIEEAAVPKGAEITEVATINKLETYFTKGAPSTQVLQISGKGFEVKPVIHPNEIFLDQGASFEVLNDGKPVKDLGFSVYRGGNTYEDKKVVDEVKTDAQGRLALKLDKPGIYMMKTRYPALPKGPITEKPAPQSVSYSLTFEVTR